MGALALATEPPTDALLNRRPYKRSANLISRPMMRNIAAQSIFQLILLFVLLFDGERLFGVHKNGWCKNYRMLSSGSMWSPATLGKTTNSSTIDVLTCKSFPSYCPDQDGDCYERMLKTPHGYSFSFNELASFSDCVKCSVEDYTHGTD